MKAAVCTKYGDPSVIELAEIPVPQIAEDELLIRVRAVTLDSADVRMRGLKAPFPLSLILRLILGLTKPRRPVLGRCFSGVVEKAGRACGRFRPGERVFGSTEGMAMGAHAEYVKVRESAPLAGIPAGADDVQAASLLFGGCAALYFLEKAGYSGGMSILVLGGGGAVGSSAVQLSARRGLLVHAVGSAASEGVLRQLGAGKVFDRRSEWMSGAQRYDIVFDAAGKFAKKEMLPLLRSGGKFVTVASTDVARESRAQVEELRRAFEEGTLRAVIDRIYPLEAIREAHAYVDRGEKLGAVAVEP